MIQKIITTYLRNSSGGRAPENFNDRSARWFEIFIRILRIKIESLHQKNILKEDIAKEEINMEL
jgi:hypothetical protein